MSDGMKLATVWVVLVLSVVDVAGKLVVIVAKLEFRPTRQVGW